MLILSGGSHESHILNAGNKMLPKSLLACALAGAIFPAYVANAAVVPQLSFSQLVRDSQYIVEGRITSSYAEWDRSRTAIWTHYRVEILDALKGPAPRSLEICEPGGEIGGVGMLIPGMVQYAVNEHVVVFLQKVPNGYLRTYGMQQGKVAIGDSTLRSSVKQLDGLDLANLKQKVRTEAARAAR